MLRYVAAAMAILLTIAAGLWLALDRHNSPPIRVGILHSLTGTMADSEKPVVEMALWTIEQINRRGGLLGRQVEAVVADGQSDPAVFARQAERLIGEEKVAVLFGCWTSASRKAVKPVVERHRHLLFYPVQYEGMEESAHIIYTGAAPNQQLIPGFLWAVEHLGRRIYLIGSDYVFPRVANLLFRDLATAKRAAIVGERYLPLGAPLSQEILDDMARGRPDVILNTINGDSNRSLFQSLAARRSENFHPPVVSFSLAEVEQAQIGTALTAGHYAVWNYFQTLDTPLNHQLVQAYRASHGEKAVVDDPMQATHLGIQLWAQAVRDTGSLEPAVVDLAIAHSHVDAPQGVVSVDRGTRHLFKSVYVGRARNDGQFDIVWASSYPILPAPFPTYRTHGQWLRLMSGMDPP